MFYFIEYLNNSKKYQGGLRFLLRHVFPEYSTASSTDYNWSDENSTFNITISSNDGLKLNGSDSEKRSYYLDENVKRPVIFITELPIEIDVHSDGQKYLILSSLSEESDSSIFFPIITLVYLEYLSKGYLFNKNEFIPVHRKKFLAYNECKPLFQREKFMKTLLSKIGDSLKRTTCCLGDCVQHECSNKKIDQDDPKAIFKEYSEYNFILAMECVEKKGHITGKILDVFLAGAIPIYSGDHELAKKLFNPAAFICIRDFESFEACVDHIISMTADDIHRMKMEKMFVNGKTPDTFNVSNKVANNLYIRIKQKIRALNDN